MTKRTIGIVDYGVGNHSSVRHALHQIGYRCRIASDPAVLNDCDLLVLPGVGAFRPAMEALQERKLDSYLKQQVERGRPMLGFCLGMQLLAAGSHENGFTRGLGVVPGEVVPFDNGSWHIGWNTIELSAPDVLFEGSDGEAFFFNHSYVYQGPAEHQVCRTNAGREFTSVLRRARVAGLQFHPEKSQSAGRALLLRLIEGLCDA